jgi:hypothetical protein
MQSPMTLTFRHIDRSAALEARARYRPSAAALRGTHYAMSHSFRNYISIDSGL